MSRPRRDEARRYRHRAAYQEATSTPDAYGVDVETWSTLLTLRVEVRGLNGREAMRLGEVTATQSVAVVHRWVADGATGRPRPRGRYVLDSGRTLHVTSVLDEDGNRRELTAICTEDAEASS